MNLKSYIHTLVQSKLWSLGSQFLSDYMDKLILNAGKWVFEKVANQQTFANAVSSVGSRNPDHLIKSPLHPNNISDLTSKPVRTNYVQI